MTNYYTQMAQAFAMPKNQADWCLAVHAAYEARLEDNETFVHGTAYAAVVDRLIAKELEFSGVELAFRPGDDGGADSLWITGDETTNPEYVAALLQEWLAAFEIAEPVYFSWSDTCDKDKNGAFGGGACVVWKDRQRAVYTNQWIQEILAEPANTSGVTSV